MNKFYEHDTLALEKVQQYKKSVIKTDANRFVQILSAVEVLLHTYSYSAYQTYPRPSHPDEQKRTDVYFTMVAILLSLRTTLENEQKATTEFLNRYKNPFDVLRSSVDELANVIKAAGMPQKKAETIIRATKYVVDKFGGDFNRFRDMSIEQARNELKNIPGVGDKSADCLLELGLDLPSIVIDVNMLRVVSRMFSLSFAANPDLSNNFQLESVKKIVETNVPKDGFLYQIVHTMLLVHGKYTCQATPKCEKCIIARWCNYNKIMPKSQQTFNF